jgi:hypothetical protein
MILDDQDTILDPRGHDELLFDDDTFSRSRLYFWAMDRLDKFLLQIQNTITEWEHLWAAREAMIRAFDEAHWQRCRDLNPERFLYHWGVTEAKYTPSNVYLDEVREQINRLRDYQVQFDAFRAKTDALRGGVRDTLYPPGKQGISADLGSISCSTRVASSKAGPQHGSERTSSCSPT